MKRLWIMVAALSGILAPPVAAHEVRPAYLEMRQTAPDTFDVLWKVPARGENERLSLTVRLPDGCRNVTEPRGMFAGGAYIERWSVRHPDALVGAEIRVEGLETTLTDALVRIERLDGSTQVERLMPERPTMVVEAAPSRGHVAWIYLVLGVEHLLLGIDHLLFVVALVLLVRGWKRVVGTITAFTIAHSLTLAAATLGPVHVPGPPVEAAIALSILFVAAEIIHGTQGRPGLAARRPWIIAFVFGLLHGFGFAGALTEVGLPQNAIPMALLFFNLGVEIGQLLFVLGLVIAVTILRSAARAAMPADFCARVLQPSALRVATYAIGAVASYWVIERTWGMLA